MSMHFIYRSHIDNKVVVFVEGDSVKRCWSHYSFSCSHSRNKKSVEFWVTDIFYLIPKVFKKEYIECD